MQEDNSTPPNKSYIGKAVEIAIRIALIAFVIWWCIDILKPFISIVIWAVIIAVALYPAFLKLSKFFGGREKLASITITLFLLAIVIIPTILLTGSVVQGVSKLKGAFENGRPMIPPPGDRIDSWPVIGKPIKKAWTAASKSLDSAIVQYRPQLKAAGSRVIGMITGISLGIIQLIVSTIIAGVLLVYAKEGNLATISIAKRLTGSNGEKFADLSKNTIKQVVKGILGVAVIQAVMAALGFFVAGVPAAGLLTVICLILFIVQVGAGLLMIPTIIYVFSVTSAFPATLYAIWMVITYLSGNVLTPIFLGRGATVPMLVIFLGAIGGFISMGFIGLFLGAVVLSVAYNLYLFWLSNESEAKVSIS